MDSRIPSFRARKKIRLSMHENTSINTSANAHTNTNTNTSTLRDVTNTLENGMRYGFKKKLSFGDEKMMEEIKRRERKVLRDINQLRSAIDEIEKETEKVRSVEIPQLRRNFSLKQDLIKSLTTEISALDEYLDVKVGECEDEREDQAQVSKNMSMKYGIEVTNEETKWDQQLSESRHGWDSKIFDMIHSKPDPDHVEEINSLKQELADCESHWKVMEQENIGRCHERTAELDKEFIQYKAEKTVILEELKSKERELALTLEQTQINCDLSKKDSEKNADKISAKKKEILDITHEINKLDNEVIPLDSDLRLARTQFREIQADCDHVNQICEKLKVENKQIYDKYIQEKRLKKRLQFAIEEMQGNIRNFAVLNDRTNFSVEPLSSSSKPSSSSSSSSTSSTVTSSGTSLFCKLNNRRYQFSRILDIKQLQSSQLFGEEFETYFDTLLRKQQNFSLFLCNPARLPIDLMDTINKFLAESPLLDIFQTTRQETGFLFKSKSDNSTVQAHIVELTDDIEKELQTTHRLLLRSTIPCFLHAIESSSSSVFMYLDLSQRLMKERKPI